MFNDVSKKKRMPQLFTAKIQTKLLKNKDQFKSWWRQLTQKSNKSSSSDASSHTTLDWRSLSPDRPPLPFFLPESPTSSTTSIDRSIITYPTTTTTTNITPNNNNTTLDIEAKRYSNNTNNITNNTTTSNNNKSTLRNTTENYQPLCPILEESETMITESTGSNLIVNNSNSPRISESDTESINESPPIATSSKQAPTTTTIQDKPEIVASSSSTSSSSQQPWPEIKAIQKTPSDRYMPQDLVGNEDKCKRKFAKMVLAARKYQTEQKQEEERPSHMALLFDVDGNIDMMRMVRQGKSEYHKFCGNSQYVPPELSTNIEYQSELADIWVLGIFLYRMLVGKYPFSAPNDQQLFKKMLHSDFSIPNELSDDAKDIIRRMLAPDSTRASLDLIIYHPWIKIYRPLLLDQYKETPVTKKQRNMSIRSIRRSNSVNTAPDSITNQASKPKKIKYNKRGPKFIKKAIMFIFQGPFPPPKKPYRDLAHLGTRESVFAKQQQQQQHA